MTGDTLTIIRRAIQRAKKSTSNNLREHKDPTYNKIANAFEEFCDELVDSINAEEIDS